MERWFFCTEMFAVRVVGRNKLGDLSRNRACMQFTFFVCTSGILFNLVSVAVWFSYSSSPARMRG